jgi:hypothetical protein
MPIAFVLDENLRGKPLWHAIRHYNFRAGPQIDATRVGDPVDLPLGSEDSEILIWAQRVDRIVIREDAATVPAALASHVRCGQSSPGVFLIRPSATVASILWWLELVVADDRPDQWRDRVIYIV